jgi:hypothetical protein
MYTSIVLVASGKLLLFNKSTQNNYEQYVPILPYFQKQSKRSTDPKT